MNVRGTSMCLLCAGALFVACGSKSGKTAEVAGQADTVHVVGGDKDKHGCIASAGYNYSAGNYPRLKQAIRWSLVLTTSYCILWTVVIFSFSTSIIGWFGEDVNMQKTAVEALNINTIMFFTLGFQFVYAAFYMSAGMGLHSLLLNVSRQGIIFIPIILILPTYWGLRGVLYTPMVADLLSTILTLFYAFKAKSVLYNKENPINIRMR